MDITSNMAARSSSRSPDGVPPSTSDSIMMWGAKGSGKSVYIASLVYWSPPADAARRVCVLPANSTAAEWVADRVRSLTASGIGHREWGIETSPASPIPEVYKTLTERRLDFR